MRTGSANVFPQTDLTKRNYRMKKKSAAIFYVFALCFSHAFAQSTHLDTLRNPDPSKPVSVLKLGSDSLSSQFVIWVNTEVKPHRHQFHSENVYILSGEGIMKLGENEFAVRQGSLIFIPRNTVHSMKVTSSEPLKLISVQSPEFDGKDRIFTDQ